MLGPIFVFSLLAYICVRAIVRPSIGVIGYYGFVLLMPEWNWRWSLPPDFPYQKYIAIATVLGFLLSSLKGNRWDNKTWLSCASLGVFLALAFLSSLFSIGPDASAFYLDALWKIILMALIAVCVLDRPTLITSCLWVASLAQGYNAYQINESYFKYHVCIYQLGTPWGAKGDNNLYSNMTVPLIATAASLMFCSRKLWQKLLAGAILVLELHQIMLFESRGAMLGGMVMLPLILWYMPKTKLNIAALCVAVFCGSILAGPPVVKEFNSIFVPKDQRDDSAESRFTLWRVGWAITKDNPLLGVGPYCGQFVVPRYLGGEGTKGLHNLMFEISSGCGIPATCCYFLFFLIPWVACAIRLSRWRDPLPDWAYTALLSVVPGSVGYFLGSMFSSGALLESSYLLGAIGLATLLVLKKERSREESDMLAIAEYHQHALLPLDARSYPGR